jgi:hypothetical protein
VRIPLAFEDLVESAGAGTEEQSSKQSVKEKSNVETARNRQIETGEQDDSHQDVDLGFGEFEEIQEASADRENAP